MSQPKILEFDPADLDAIRDDDVEEDSGASLGANNNFVASVQFSWAS